jgi:hypothetical protein
MGHVPGSLNINSCFPMMKFLVLTVGEFFCVMCEKVSSLRVANYSEHKNTKCASQKTC